MNTINRRQFLKYMGSGSALLAAIGPLSSCTKTPKATGRVVVVGGGFGGSTCAKYLQRFDPMLDITLVEPGKRFVTCPFSNMVMTGMREMDSISYDYSVQRKRGINIVHASVKDIDPVNKRVTLDNGKQLGYDRLVLSPGIDFRWDAVEGISAADADTIPHAWQGGAQTTVLRDQLTAMPDGGVFIIAPPGNPFRCPPGPYERISLVANYFKQHKPNAKILVLDHKDKFSKQPLFTQGWEALYPGMIEWISGSKGGRVYRIDPATREIETESGDRHKGDVVNYIPQQKAAPIVHRAGLTNNDGWCPVDQRTFESSIHPGIHVIGDASIAGKMPKSGFAANSQGKVCAAAIVSALHSVPMPDPSYVNTCYSLVGPDYGISVAAVYRYGKDKGIYKVKGSGGVSPKDADKFFRQQEARYAEGWYASITSDAFG